MRNLCRTAFVTASSIARGSFLSAGTSTSSYLAMSSSAPAEVGIKYPELVSTLRPGVSREMGPTILVPDELGTEISLC